MGAFRPNIFLDTANLPQCVAGNATNSTDVVIVRPCYFVLIRLLKSHTRLAGRLIGSSYVVLALRKVLDMSHI